MLENTRDVGHQSLPLITYVSAGTAVVINAVSTSTTEEDPEEVTVDDGVAEAVVRVEGVGALCCLLLLYHLLGGERVLLLSLGLLKRG